MISFYWVENNLLDMNIMVSILTIAFEITYYTKSMPKFKNNFFGITRWLLNDINKVKYDINII